jgi:hypothetical protein
LKTQKRGNPNIKEGDRVFVAAVSTPGHEKARSYGIVVSIIGELAIVDAVGAPGKCRTIEWLHHLDKRN